MKSKKITFLILILMMSLIPEARAITPQEQTVKITDTHDDMFITEIGIGIDSSLVTIKDPGMDIRAFLVFRELDINYWEPLENATLRLHTSNTLSFDADSSVTIYGIKLSDLQLEGFLLPSTVLSLGYTSAHTNYNTSQFYGQQWHEIDVTDIIEELIRNPNWDGDGISGTETGDAIGFHILGDEGDEKRYFYDYRVGNGLEAQLIIHWNHEPPPPTGYEKAEYIGEYGNFTIWYINETGYSNEPIEYVFARGSPFEYYMSYDTVHAQPETSVDVGYSQTDTLHATGSQRKLVRTSDGTLHATWCNYVDNNQLYYKKSIDDGANWISETLISTAPGMASHTQSIPSIAVDSRDNIHVSWRGRATGVTTDDQIWHTKYNATTTSWSDPIRLSNYTGMENVDQIYQSIAVDSNDDIHILWSGQIVGFAHQIWYVNYTTSWTFPMRISNATGMTSKSQSNPSIAIDSEDNLHIIWGGEATGFADNQIWYANRTTSWSIPTNITSITGHIQRLGCIAINSEEHLQVVWDGTSGIYSKRQIWYTDYITSWSAPTRISTHTLHIGRDSKSPTITVDSDDYLYVLWYGLDADSIDAIWYAKYETDWTTPEMIHQGVFADYTCKWPNLRWSRWPGYVPEQFMVFDNDTLIQDDLDTLDDAEDWIDDYDPHPEDPSPGTAWGDWDTGPFTRFKMRFYFLILGLSMLFGPMFYFAYQRPSGYRFIIGLFIMFVGFAFLISMGSV